MVTLIDNYDSFTYNLVQYLGDLKAQTRVYRNDEKTADKVLGETPDAIVISPGPSDPDHAGICLELIRKTADTDIPLFGVCLGLQSMAQAFGGKVVRAPKPMHGKISQIAHRGQTVFKGLPSPLEVTRYHSLIAERDSLPECLESTAETEDGLIMGLSHKSKPIHGVQFHPESIATSHGHDLLKNFLDMVP
ncbi:MAG: aminodeoxychorismate/anthranilate synthase component II [Rhodospirillales bacterium]|nr:aminodeoxychorismate/anthranilate synthase component II [Alphaproteobacteria bacterium]MCB1840482.1 aminodeoxychorismate/anthranilate synthase component II [Alphaproteobacteria bacterium]MCB9977420.1 aminodeoxychorismate/anthranilate synthase component II [Rhodospirillales bacterium]